MSTLIKVNTQQRKQDTEGINHTQFNY